MARDGTESDSEEERHDRFRSERSNISLNATKSLYGNGLQQSIKSRSPFRRVNSPSRRDRRSPIHRSRSRSKRRSKERKKSKDRRESKEKYERDDKRHSRRSSSKHKEARRSDGKDSGKIDDRSRSKDRRRSESKEKKRKRENRKSYSDYIDQSNDTFAQKFERRRHSVENEIVESTTIYRDSSCEPESRLVSKTSHESRLVSKTSHESRSHKKERKRKKNHGDAEEGELISEDENNCFGPALPPRIESEEEDGELKDSKSSEGPALPPDFDSRTIGPILPERPNSRRRSIPQEEQRTKSQRTSKSDSDEEKKKRIIGPILPSREMLQPIEKPAEDGSEEALYGPALPPSAHTFMSDEDPLIGPLPRGMELDDRVQRILEERAQSLKKQMENKDSGGNSEEKGRESWMTELPDIKTVASMGLGPRKFRSREGPDLSDRSSWTDTPSNKKNKQDNQESTTDVADSRRLEITARNEEMERKAKHASSHRDKSLLEMHQKELKKKKKKELENSGGKVERRPFSREIDLQTNRFDDAQKRSIISKAQLLDSRFSSGESKYL